MLRKCTLLAAYYDLKGYAYEFRKKFTVPAPSQLRNDAGDACRKAEC